MEELLELLQTELETKIEERDAYSCTIYLSVDLKLNSLPLDLKYYSEFWYNN